MNGRNDAPARNPRESDRTRAALHGEMTGLLVERLRASLWLILVTNLLFALASYTLDRPNLGALYAIKLVQIAALAWIAWMLRRPCTWERALSLALFNVAIMCLNAAASGVILRGVASAPLIFIVVCMATATLLPWGVWPQVATVAMAALALLWNVHAAGGIAATFGYPIVSCLAAFPTSIYVAYEFERYRLQRRAAEDALAASRARLEDEARLKSEFVSTMSHELRTPLNVILGYADILEEEIGEDPLNARRRRELIERIKMSGRELLELVDNTLEIGRINAGTQDVRLEPVSLPALWTTLKEVCARMPRRAEVALEWSADIPSVSLVTDPRKLTVMVRNLVGNALKFTERGRVHVGFAMSAEAAVVRVADTGIGIRPEDQERIFELFRQADGSDSRRFGGTGLGLYIVRQFARQLGGTVELDSAPGRGATFTITLPLASPAPALEVSASTPVESNANGHPLVM